MGAGLAKEAKQKFPSVPQTYGKLCKLCRDRTPPLVMRNEKILLFPTKPLNADSPHLSWKSHSCPDLIERGMADLYKGNWPQELKRRIVFTPLGCSNGRLNPKDILPIMFKYWRPEYILSVHNHPRLLRDSWMDELLMGEEVEII